MLIHSKYRPDIDGLRAIAILAVIAFHAFPARFKSGYTGVDIFFVISGFLISMIIFSSLEKDRFSFAEFYARRVKRIFPALILVMASSYVFGWIVLFADEFSQLGKHIGGGSIFISNFILWSETGYFDNASESKPLLHLWSLGIEEQFYILWPFIIWVTYKRHVGFFAVTVLVLCGSFLFNIGAVLKHQDDIAFFSPYTRFWELMVGGFLAYINIHRPMLINRFPNINSLVGIFLVLGALLTLRKHTEYPGYRALMPVMGAFFLISAGQNAWINRKILSNKILVSIGLISYPLYLWHWVIFSYLWILEGGALDASIAIGAILLSFLLAISTYWFIERPIKEIKMSSNQGVNTVLILFLLMIIVGTIGFFTFKQNGFSSRLANEYALDFNGTTSFESNPNLPVSSCQEIFGMPVISNERCFSNTKHPEYLVLGDSHADSFYEATSLQGISLLSIKIAKNNMLPFLGFVSHYARDTADHYGQSILVVNHAIDIVGQYQSIKTVILVTRGQGYFTERNAISKLGSDEKLPLFDAERAFVEGYSDLISRFTKMGKKVVFITEWPELDHPPHSFIPRAINLKSASHDDVMRRQDVESKQRMYLNLVAEIKLRNPEVLVFDTLPIFCDEQNCSAKDDKTIYYSDENHLNINGSRRVLIEFISWMKALGNLVGNGSG